MRRPRPPLRNTTPNSGGGIPAASSTPFGNCRLANADPGSVAAAPSAATTALAAFAKDTSPAADAIKGLLKNPSKEAAAALLKDLPSLIPDDPALAAVIAEEMARAFGDGRAQAPAAPHEDGEITQEGERK